MGAAGVESCDSLEYNCSVEGLSEAMTGKTSIDPQSDAPRGAPGTPAISRELLEEIAERLKALADPTRLAILHALDPLDVDERCVGDLAELVGTSQANVSKHLGVLRHAGLVSARREGMNVFYSAADAAAFEVCRLMCGVVERRAQRDLATLHGPADRGDGTSPEVTA